MGNEDVEFMRAKKLANAINGTHIVNAFINQGVSFVTVAAYRVHPEKSSYPPWAPSPYGEWAIKCTHAEVFVTLPVPVDTLPDNCCDDPHLVHRDKNHLFLAAASNCRDYAFRCVHIPVLEDEAAHYCVTAADVMNLSVLNPNWCEQWLTTPYMHKPYCYIDDSPDATLVEVLDNAGRLADLGCNAVHPQLLSCAGECGFRMSEYPASGDPHIAETKENAQLMADLLNGWYLLGGDRELRNLHAVKVAAVPNGSNDGVYVTAEHSFLYPDGGPNGAALVFRGSDGKLHGLRSVNNDLQAVANYDLLRDFVPAAGSTRGEQLKAVMYDPAFFMTFGHLAAPCLASESYVAPEFKLDSVFWLMDALNHGAMRLTPSNGNIILDGGQCCMIERCLAESGY